MAEWVSCKDRFPEYGKFVLTFDGNYYAIEARIPYIVGDAEKIKSEWWVGIESDIENEDYDNLRDGAATHWMELPLPPE